MSETSKNLITRSHHSTLSHHEVVFARALKVPGRRPKIECFSMVLLLRTMLLLRLVFQIVREGKDGEPSWYNLAATDYTEITEGRSMEMDYLYTI